MYNFTPACIRKPWIHVQTGPRCDALWYNDLTIHLITSQRLWLPFRPSVTHGLHQSLITFIIPALKIQDSLAPVSANLMLILTSGTINKSGRESTGVLHRVLFLNHVISIKSSANQRGRQQGNKPLQQKLPVSQATLRLCNTYQRLMQFGEIPSRPFQD